MSNTLYAFLKRTHVPDRGALQSAIDAMLFPLQLDPDYTRFEDSGFSPCTLLQKEGAGFEIFYEPTAELAEDDAELRTIAGENDYCISLVWHSSREDSACAQIVAAALALHFGAIVSYEGEDPDEPQALVEQAREAVRDLLVPEISLPRATPGKESAPSEPMTIKVTVRGLPGGKTLTRCASGQVILTAGAVARRGLRKRPTNDAAAARRSGWPGV